VPQHDGAPGQRRRHILHHLRRTRGQRKARGSRLPSAPPQHEAVQAGGGWWPGRATAAAERLPPDSPPPPQPTSTTTHAHTSQTAHHHRFTHRPPHPPPHLHCVVHVQQVVVCHPQPLEVLAAGKAEAEALPSGLGARVVWKQEAAGEAGGGEASCVGGGQPRQVLQRGRQGRPAAAWRAWLSLRCVAAARLRTRAAQQDAGYAQGAAHILHRLQQRTAVACRGGGKQAWWWRAGGVRGWVVVCSRQLCKPMPEPGVSAPLASM
jgi:hypothetical protein